MSSKKSTWELAIEFLVHVLSKDKLFRRFRWMLLALLVSAVLLGCIAIAALAITPGSVLTQILGAAAAAGLGATSASGVAYLRARRRRQEIENESDDSRDSAEES